MFISKTVQLCVVYRIRNSIKYFGSQNQKEFLTDLKCVYQAVNKEFAENELLKLKEKWGEQHSLSSGHGRIAGINCPNICITLRYP